MASYSLRVKRSAEHELRSVSKPDLARLVHRIQALVSNPWPPGAEKLSGEDAYRIRQGDWRVIYTIDDDATVINIIKIGHRREVYR